MNKTVQFKNYFLKLLIISFFIISTLTSCGIYKKSDARKVSPNADERVKQNIKEGKGIKLGNLGGTGKGGDFQFASSNELWRATLEVLDFLPLSNVDYSGGIIITDWASLAYPVNGRGKIWRINPINKKSSNYIW